VLLDTGFRRNDEVTGNAPNFNTLLGVLVIDHDLH